MHDTILQAISQKKCLQFSYNNLERIVEPHALGKSRKENDIMRAYQKCGESESGGLPEWRLFLTSEMHDVQLLDEEAQVPREGYKRGDKAMDEIYSQV